MAERFIYPPTAGHAARVSVANGASTAVFTNASLSNHDWASAKLWITPDDAAPYLVGLIAEGDPQGVYDNLELPLFRPWPGTAIVDAKFALVDGLAIAKGATQAEIFARYTAHLEQNMGLVGNLADTIDTSLIPNNTLFVDSVTRAIYQWRNGVMEQVLVVGGSFTPRGVYSSGTTYAKNDLVQSGNYVYVSNVDANLNHTPDGTPGSTAYWTWMPLPASTSGFVLQVSIGGRPAAGEFIPGHLFKDTVTFTGNSSLSAKCRVAPTTTRVISIMKNGVEVATVTFTSAGTTGTCALTSSPVTFAAGDYQDVQCPAIRDDAMSDIRIAWKGSRP